MNKWEYTVVAVEFEKDAVFVRDHERDGTFMELGERGWELVAVQQVSGTPLAFFKRQLRPAPGAINFTCTPNESIADEVYRATEERMLQVFGAMAEEPGENDG